MLSRQLGLFAAIGVALVSLLNSVFIVDRRERVVLLEGLFQAGEIVGTDFAPGLHLKLPYVQSVRAFDSRVLTVDNPTESFLTQEKKNIKADFFIKWRIADTATYYRKTGGDESVTGDRLVAVVDSGLRDAFGALTIQQAVASGDAMTASLEKIVKERAAELGVEIVDVRIKRLDLPDDMLKSWHDRMSTEREGVAQALRAKGAEEAEKIRAEADQKAQAILGESYALAERTRGEGDARAAEIYAKAYGQDPEFFRFWRSLAAYRDALHDSKDVLVLEPDSEFFRYFKSAGPSGK